MIKLVSTICIFLVLAACSTASSPPDEPLQERYWRALEIDGKPIARPPGANEPHVVLGQQQRAHGSDGCNRFNGSWQTDKGLRFGQLASTMMACPPPIDAQARSFTQALSATADYRIRGKQMELLDADGKVRLRLEATFLK